MSTPQSSGPPTLTLLTRAECGLCEEMQAALQALGRRAALPPIAIVDVDSDAQLQRRYGLKIPVLLLGATPVCSQRLDASELLRLLGRP
ncbi:MAG: glutaredoxin family protein [Steroidobacteraceae bacterium]